MRPFIDQVKHFLWKFSIFAIWFLQDGHEHLINETLHVLFSLVELFIGKFDGIRSWFDTKVFIFCIFLVQLIGGKISSFWGSLIQILSDIYFNWRIFSSSCLLYKIIMFFICRGVDEQERDDFSVYSWCMFWIKPLLFLYVLSHSLFLNTR